MKGMVCAPQPEAVEAGVVALQKGGNAVDAAIACALVQTVVDPQMCGIAGFGTMHLYLAEIGKHLFIDFHGRAPEKVTEDMWADRIVAETDDGFGFILEGHVNDLGYQSITSPGSLAGFSQAIRTFGRLDLAELLEPAIEYCEQGFAVRPHVSYFWNLTESAGRIGHRQRLTHFPATAKIYQRSDGSIPAPGEIHRNPDMGATYRKIAREGIDSFYRGDIAQTIVTDMQNNGGLLNAKDLAEYQPQQREPLWGKYRGLKVATNNPPGGGVMILEMLNILENFDLNAMGHNSPEYIATVSEAMKIATVDKDKYLGDPNFIEMPLEKLLSVEYAFDMAARIRRGEKTPVPRYKRAADNKDTTHVCTTDELGNCVSMTHSLGNPSGVVTEGLGFMYNGCMNVFDPRPGNADSIQPGKSRFTAMSPTIIFENGKPALIIGAPGGTYITMGILQGILNVIDFSMTAQEAVSAPRFCATSSVIDICNRVPRYVEQELNTQGFTVRRSHLSYHFAGVHAIRVKDGKWDGGADPGRDGMALASHA